MTGEQRVQTRKCVDVVERLIGPGGRIPLVVAFGIDANEKMDEIHDAGYRS